MSASLCIRGLLILCIFSVLSALLVGCLPLDSTPPECFPDEQCDRGSMCIKGRCVVPPARSISVELSCLQGMGCGEELDARGLSSACLVLEQPHALISVPVELAQALSPEGAQVSVPLMPSDLRASILLLTSPPEDLNLESLCGLTDTEIERLQLHRGCSEELGCLLRLRREPLTLEASQDDEEPLTLSFSGTGGECAESLWSATPPTELCGGGDHDCDGFVDEGLRCEAPDTDADVMTP